MSGRWTQYDSVEYRTGGMKCVGYDADTQVYYFQDETGMYEGEPGNQYGGRMRRIGPAPSRRPAVTSPKPRAHKPAPQAASPKSDEAGPSKKSFAPVAAVVQMIGRVRTLRRARQERSKEQATDDDGPSSPEPKATPKARQSHSETKEDPKK
ncbi:hypothetical protein FRC18_004668 [Serendipita sp. 400]|nr:hypothetical protein FRC18_004668 [Serendipita sp. 400]